MKLRQKLLIIIIAISAVVLISYGFLLNNTTRQVNAALDQTQVFDEIARDVLELNIVTSDYFLDQEDRAKTQWGLKFDSLAILFSGISANSPETIWTQ